jgi:uncharacterized protein
LLVAGFAATNHLPTVFINLETKIIPISKSGAGEKFLIFRPLLRMAFIGNQAMARLALQVSGGTRPQEPTPGQQAGLDFLEQIGFLQPDPTPLQSTHPPYQPSWAVLLMTNQCQLRCVYCYAAAGEAGEKRSLSLETAKAVIRQTCQNALARGLPEFVVTFHGGGEPTQAFKTMVKAAEFARQQPLPAVLSIMSNGVWSDRQREWIIANIQRIGISMDGRPETQDRQRPLAGGRPSSPQVLKTLKELDQQRVRYGIRITAKAPWDTLDEDVRWIYTHTTCQDVQIEPAFNEARGEVQAPDWEQHRSFAEGFIKAFLVARKNGRMISISGGRPGLVSESFCTAPYDALIVTPTNRLVACYEITNDDHPMAEMAHYGEVVGGEVVMNPEAVASLWDKIAERRAECRDCFCYWSCAGDCFVHGFASGPQGHLVRSPRCDLNRFVTLRMILSMVEQGGGIWRGMALNNDCLPAPLPLSDTTGQ